jgi:cyclopropane fatty-acyl-phospholipid synthase-like methyltransferase
MTCVVELSGVKAGDWVLDVACGSGDHVLYYEQKGAIANGVDRNPNMIQQVEAIVGICLGVTKRPFIEISVYTGNYVLS